jgi:hypothetical protein
MVPECYLEEVRGQPKRWYQGSARALWQPSNTITSLSMVWSLGCSTISDLAGWNPPLSLVLVDGPLAMHLDEEGGMLTLRCMLTTLQNQRSQSHRLKFIAQINPKLTWSIMGAFTLYKLSWSKSRVGYGVLRYPEFPGNIFLFSAPLRFRESCFTINSLVLQSIVDHYLKIR